MTKLLQLSLAFLTMTSLAFVAPATAQVKDEDRLEAFLEVTGFDVALESIKLTASTAPQMIGLEADDFGVQWTILVDEVFDTDLMHNMAVEILAETLDEDLLEHAVDFYTSDLGSRLVVVENRSHLEEDDGYKSESGEAIVAGLVQIGSPRLEELKRLNAATGSEDASIHAIQEVQVRFLMAAASAGVIDMRMEEDDLREALRQQEGEMRRNMQLSGLASSAYTYQSFSDDEITAYADALEDERMQKVYALMNAVQFEIMADRYEAVALGLKNLQPSQEL